MGINFTDMMSGMTSHKKWIVYGIIGAAALFVLPRLMRRF